MAAPIKVRVGSVQVKIYSSPQHGKVRYRVVDYLGGHKNKKDFSQRCLAELYARERAQTMAHGEAARYEITPQEAYEFKQAKEILAPTGQSLLQAAQKVRDEWEITTKLHLADSPIVPDVVNQFLNEKKRQQAGKYHLQAYRDRLENRFAPAFQLPINRIDATSIRDWLNALTCKRRPNQPAKPLTARTWNNYLDALRALFKFAIARKYLPADWAGLEGLDKIKLRRRQITIFRPEDMEILLASCSARLLPALVISAFAGLRSEEVLRLQWKHVNREKGYIFLPAEITKTNTPRAVPIADNLLEWLADWREASGQVCDYANLSEGKRNLSRRLGITWPRNGLRDSYISYRHAVIQDKAKVASEAGNTPAMIDRYYLELTTESEGRRWFEIRPKSVRQNILPLQFR